MSAPAPDPAAAGGDAAGLAAVILSAGSSRRMGGFKPLMQLEGATVLERAVVLFRSAGIGAEAVFVVAGHRAEAVCFAADHLGVRCVRNPRPADGMFSSVQAGLRAAAPGSEAVFVLPVDQPLVRVRTVSALIQARKRRPGAYWQPVFRGRPGHPPLLGPEAAAEVLRRHASGSLRDVLDRHRDGAVSVSVVDEGIVTDLDSPEDFEAAQTRIGRWAYPSEAEALSLIEDEFRLTPSALDKAVRAADAAQAVAAAWAGKVPPPEAWRTRSIALLSVLLDAVPEARRENRLRLAGLGFSKAADDLLRLETVTGTEPGPPHAAQVVSLARWLVDGGAAVREGIGEEAVAEAVLRGLERTAAPDARPRLRETVARMSGGRWST